MSETPTTMKPNLDVFDKDFEREKSGFSASELVINLQSNDISMKVAAYEKLGFINFSILESKPFISLYRVEGETFNKEDLVLAQKGNAGLRFTTNLVDTEKYAKNAVHRNIYKIDVPEEFHNGGNVDHPSTDGEIILPEKLAILKQPITKANMNSIDKTAYKMFLIENAIDAGKITSDQVAQVNALLGK